ncbi:unnamed protein product [Paramecium pentaurelia]|uniref:Uncharacterized protein n=1 Tax=Paramecium pentaurelia TaxID=43138 RepID=A0A8S1X1J4_9CILI|nr:unnamed protein product [Paramecium pentaurelia]
MNKIIRIKFSFYYASRIDCAPIAGVSCNPKSQTALKYCTDLTCTQIATLDLHSNDQFVLQKVITTGATIISVSNKQKNQVIIQLKAEILLRAVNIKEISTLSINQAGDIRILFQTPYYPVNG